MNSKVNWRMLHSWHSFVMLSHSAVSSNGEYTKENRLCRIRARLHLPCRPTFDATSSCTTGLQLWTLCWLVSERLKRLNTCSNVLPMAWFQLADLFRASQNSRS